MVKTTAMTDQMKQVVLTAAPITRPPPRHHHRSLAELITSSATTVRIPVVFRTAISIRNVFVLVD